MMLVLQIFLLCVAVQITFSAEIGSLENLRDQTFNRPQNSASRPCQNNKEDVDVLIEQVFGTPSPKQTDDCTVNPDPPNPDINRPNPDVSRPNPDDMSTGTCTCVPFYLCSSNQTVIEDGTGLLDIRIQGPCGDYMETCCSQATGTRIIPKPTIRKGTCGQRKSDGVGFRITGAEDNESQFGEFPWMVAILRLEPVQDGTTLNVYQCGGSLIHTQVVLTAAHCVYRKNPTNLRARAGEWDTQTKNELIPHQDRNIKEIVVHEQYYPGALYNDIALLILESPFDTAENVDIICLPDQGEIMDGRKCVASGWGKDVFGAKGKYQVIMKKVELPIVPRTTCLEALRKTRLSQHFKLHESFICAGGELGKDTCKGDGGSPLVCPSRDNSEIYRQAGIVAWGIDCGKATPGVYVNVPLFREWITSKLSSYNFS